MNFVPSRPQDYRLEVENDKGEVFWRGAPSTCTECGSPMRRLPTGGHSQWINPCDCSACTLCDDCYRVKARRQLW